MKVTIDRLEGDMVVVELPTGETIPISKMLFEAPKEGNIYEICFLDEATKERKQKIAHLMDELFE